MISYLAQYLHSVVAFSVRRDAQYCKVRQPSAKQPKTEHEERQEKTTKRDVNPANIIGGKSIGRTMFLTFCAGVRFDEGVGELIDEEWVIAGRCDRANAQKRLRQLFNDKSIIVTETNVESDYYSVPFDDFISLALLRKTTERNEK